MVTNLHIIKRVHKQKGSYETACGISSYNIITHTTWHNTTCKNCLAVKARAEKNKSKKQ